VYKEQSVRKAFRVPLVHKVLLARRVLKDFRVLLVRKDLLEHKVLSVLKVRKVLLACKVLLVLSAAQLLSSSIQQIPQIQIQVQAILNLITQHSRVLQRCTSMRLMPIH
jgi:hypothetical protein